MPIPCGHCQSPGCRLCWLYANRDDYRRHWDGPARPKQQPSRPLPPCGYEGGVIESCPRGCEAGHVRACLNESHEHDRCTRGKNNGVVASCLTCPHHTERAVFT